jgi:hypothetical protein
MVLVQILAAEEDVTSKSALLVPINQPVESLKKYDNETDNIKPCEESELESW